MTDALLQSLAQLAIEQSRIIAALVKDHCGTISGETWDDVHKRDEIISYVSSIDGDDIEMR